MFIVGGRNHSTLPLDGNVYLLWIPRLDFCLQAEVSLKEWMPRYSLSTAGPKLRDLMPGDLRWSGCSSRHKAHNKCNVLDSFQAIPHPTLPTEKLSSINPIPGGQKAEDCWSRVTGLYGHCVCSAASVLSDSS